MSKKKTGDALCRSAKRGAPGPTPLLVIAGLPQSTAEPAAAAINNDSKSRWRAVASAFTSRDIGIYSESNAILDLGVHACKFAMAATRDSEDIPTPSRIAVAYVEDRSFEQLWSVFGHAVWPIPLNHPDWKWPKGRHWRHEIEIVNQVLRRALASIEQGLAEEMRLRLEARRADDVMLLPGRNFHLDQESRLIDRFRAFMAGRITAADIEADVTIERFAYERLSAFYKRMGGRGKRFAIDCRRVVFAKSNYGQHGGKHDIPADLDISDDLLQRTLEGRYRFGTPLEPSGFQHDAQFEDGAKFDQEPFNCVKMDDVVKFNGDHVNVFPNDFVTGTAAKEKTEPVTKEK